MASTWQTSVSELHQIFRRASEALIPELRRARIPVGVTLGANTHYMVVIEHGEESWGAHLPDLPGCVAVGETRDEVLQLIREAIDLYLEGLKQDGIRVPLPTTDSSPGFSQGTGLPGELTRP